MVYKVNHNVIQVMLSNKHYQSNVEIYVTHDIIHRSAVSRACIVFVLITCL